MSSSTLEAVGGHGGLRFEHRVRVEVVAVDVQRHPRVTAHVGRLRPRVGDRNSNQIVVTERERDVRRLRPSIRFEGDQDPLSTVADEFEGIGQFHARHNRAIAGTVPVVPAGRSCIGAWGTDARPQRGSAGHDGSLHGRGAGGLDLRRRQLRPGEDEQHEVQDAGDPPRHSQRQLASAEEIGDDDDDAPEQ